MMNVHTTALSHMDSEIIEALIMDTDDAEYRAHLQAELNRRHRVRQTRLRSVHRVYAGFPCAQRIYLAVHSNKVD